MLMKIYEWRSAVIVQMMIALAFVFLVSTANAIAQQPSEAQNAVQKTPDASADKPSAAIKPVVSDLLKIKIGATAKEVRAVLGKAEVDDDDGFYYEISDEQIAQIRLDTDKKVRLISVTYSGEHKNAPQYADIFGADMDEKAAIKPDGSIYQLIRYPESGFWVAYSRTAGNKPEITVTMQKL